MNPAQQLYALAALLLAYPDDAFVEQLPQVDHLAKRLPSRQQARRLASFTHWALAVGPDRLRQDYTDTFDLRRATTLDLTYYEHGDTRDRGQALLALSGRYRLAGIEPGAGQLPDYLPALLAFAAQTDPSLGEAALRSCRPGLEVLRQALASRHSRWAGPVKAVVQTLGPLSADERQRADQLRAAGTPQEAVGGAQFDIARAALPALAARTVRSERLDRQPLRLVQGGVA
ncbi:MAG: nitrate reductase molybdenum cofactor assembly chaperone [Propionibacteriaceae bacterium]|jgi:nitrate reductase delta subunit|nr:nitrate reductase molybdenum cofactor assembly chaperone [Propionibacteriaceae bacterium]